MVVRARISVVTIERVALDARAVAVTAIRLGARRAVPAGRTLSRERVGRAFDESQSGELKREEVYTWELEEWPFGKMDVSLEPYTFDPAGTWPIFDRSDRNCRNGVATEVIGRTGAWVDALGLSCGAPQLEGQ